jgi:hypothetical protein
MPILSPRQVGVFAGFAACLKPFDPGHQAALIAAASSGSERS